jgi:hypothetical protein
MKFRYWQLIIVVILLPFIGDFFSWGIYNNSLFKKKPGETKEKYITKRVQIKSNDVFNVFIFDKDLNKYGVSLCRPEGKMFYMNSNFFNNVPIGLVVIEGRTFSKKVSSGGVFYVKNGTPDISIGKVPKNVEYGSQSILWGIKNSIPNKRLLKQNHGKILTYRNILGKNKDGDIVIVVSKYGGITSIKDVVEEGIRHGIIDGILFDGGTSVEYSFNDEVYNTSFFSISKLMKNVLRKYHPMAYVYIN